MIEGGIKFGHLVRLYPSVKNARFFLMRFSVLNVEIPSVLR